MGSETDQILGRFKGYRRAKKLISASHQVSLVTEKGKSQLHHDAYRFSDTSLSPGSSNIISKPMEIRSPWAARKWSGFRYVVDIVAISE
jgi:hypothetical protein